MADLVRRALRMNADRVIVGEVLGDEVLPMLNAMSQGRSGSMCTIHADSSAGVFRRIASYAVQAPERLPLEATNILSPVRCTSSCTSTPRCTTPLTRNRGSPAFGQWEDDLEFRRFPPQPMRTRFVSSVREVVDAEGGQVISNEVFHPGPDRRAQMASPLRPETQRELIQFGYRPPTFQMSGLVG